jgi:hypothetical protein
MKQQLQLQIPEPCHENWNNMPATEQGRFCMACKKEVIDFSAMSDREILQYISTATASICGRADNDQLNRALAMPAEPRKLWWKYWMGIAASFVMMTSKSTAQKGRVAIQPIVVVPKLPVKSIRPVMGKMTSVKNEIIIRGRAVDSNGVGIAYASVSVKNNNLGMATDSAGYFALHLGAEMTSEELVVSAVGYQPKQIELDSKPAPPIVQDNRPAIMQLGDIVLRQASLKEVVITGYGTQGGIRLGGAIGVISCRSSRFQKVKAKLKEVFVAGEIKVYPNPVPRNAAFHLNFNLTTPGDYVVQFVDISGRIFAGKKLSIVSKNYTAQFDGSMFGAGGIYFVRVIESKTSRIYSTKLIVP